MNDDDGRPIEVSEETMNAAVALVAVLLEIPQAHRLDAMAIVLRLCVDCGWNLEALAREYGWELR